MSKLFAGEDFDIEIPSTQTIEAKIENSDIPDIIETHETSIQVAVEGVLKAANDLYIVNDIRASLESKKLSSVEYFTSIENYSLYMKSIANNLGVKTKLPSMEDFKNPYGAQASHQFVMEGFVEFMRSIWEKIKSFFKDFFKKMMLFLKRLVNANLEMEEYEQYIESLMQNVKKSDKKNVESIEVDSKLPSLLSDFGMETMEVDYLFSKGKDKLENLSVLINVLTDKNIPAFEKELKNLSIIITDKFVQGYKPLPEEARTIASNARRLYIENFTKHLFPTETFLKSLPETVYGEVLNNFDSFQLEGDNAKFYSIINDTDKFETLPKNFNLYLVVAEHDTSNDADNVRTAKLMIIVHTEKNTHVRNNMKTIGNRDNLIKFYEFYKKFSKNFKIKRINDRMKDFEDSINVMIKSFEHPFTFALESDDEPAFNTPEWHAKYGAQTGERPDWVNDDFARNNTHYSNYRSNNSPDIVDDVYRPQVRKEFGLLQKFIFNVMNCTQSFHQEYSVNIAATGQECRYEMIKLLYKSAKQF